MPTPPRRGRACSRPMAAPGPRPSRTRPHAAPWRPEPQPSLGHSALQTAGCSGIQFCPVLCPSPAQVPSAPPLLWDWSGPLNLRPAPSLAPPRRQSPPVPALGLVRPHPAPAPSPAPPRRPSPPAPALGLVSPSPRRRIAPGSVPGPVLSEGSLAYPPLTDSVSTASRHLEPRLELHFRMKHLLPKIKVQNTPALPQ